MHFYRNTWSLATSEKLLRCYKQRLSWHYNSMIDCEMENKVSVETELREIASRM